MKGLTPKSPLRHGTQQGSVSARATRLLRLYEDELRIRFAERTIPDYLSRARVLLNWLEARGVELAEVRTSDLLAFQSELLTLKGRHGRPYAAETQRGYLTVVRSFFRFLYRRGYLLSDPSTSLQLPRVERKLPRTILTPEEAARVLEAADKKNPVGLRDRAILESLYGTGIRVTELANLSPYDVDLEERTLRIVRGKGRKDRHVPLTREAAAAIEAYLAHGRPRLLTSQQAGFLFLSDHGGWLHRAVLSKLVSRYVAKAKVAKHVTCHTFRHTMATHLLKGRADIRHIQVLLGHARLSSTERYTQVEITDLKEVVERAHPRGR
jgi:integrase/recombinase XerD